MNRKLFLLCLLGLLSVSSAYAKCEGGKEVTNSVGTTFCCSNVSLNWWSAAAWCKANGLHLATMYEMCPSWDGTTGGGKCPEFNGIGTGFVWSSTANGASSAFSVYDSGSGYVNYHNNPGRSAAYYALCK